MTVPASRVLAPAASPLAVRVAELEADREHLREILDALTVATEQIIGLHTQQLIMFGSLLAGHPGHLGPAVGPVPGDGRLEEPGESGAAGWRPPLCLVRVGESGTP